ncbi:MAG: hypothetical protein C4525_00905 [Desulfarculus sp.]|nr:MAG: hypothetical protein C4525_00905 [Desulfarculus sp.]
MPASSHSSRPECFGDLSRVFPSGQDGLREVSARCWDCRLRVECLRAAASKRDGREQLEQERASRGEPEGVAGFLRRWSRLKTASRREKE